MTDTCNYIEHKKQLFSAVQHLSEPLHIAFCFDNGFLMPAGVAAFSVIENNKDINLHFHLLVSNVSDNDLSLFRELKKPNVAITVYHIVDDFNINPETLVLGIPLSTCLRFLIPKVIDESINHVLYLDCDVICYGSLAHLVNYDLQNYIAGVVSDSPEMQARVNTLGYGIKFHNYFNAGVILINNIEWRRNGITAKSLEMINSGKVFRYADQDVLNILLNGSLKYLDGKYNNKTTLNVYRDAEAESRSESIIMHYVTPNKPWYKIFEANLFNDYYSRSPWKNTKRYLSPSASEIRLKAKKVWQEKNYSMAVLYYLRYFSAKIFKIRF